MKSDIIVVGGKLKRIKKLYETSHSYEDGYYDCICDEDENILGEYRAYSGTGGNIDIFGFCYNNEWVGCCYYDSFCRYYSFLTIGKQIEKDEFEMDYKKYLVKYRLGLEVPEAFLCLTRFLKDYEEPKDYCKREICQK